MERQHFSIRINAPRERVWRVLWDDATYSQWTAPFGAGGRAVSDWKEGSRVHFLSAEGDGMFSVIERREENAFMGFKHLGMLKGGEEQPADDAIREWAGAKEEYTLKQNNDGTDLSVAMDVGDSEVPAFKEMFPKALAIVKKLAEQ
ncbi:MAG: SRPBCC domain-containing protein [Flavobacteriales bacterium]